MGDGGCSCFNIRGHGDGLDFFQAITFNLDSHSE